MTKEQIHSSLDAMLSNPKSKNFINHLVRSYLPVTNIVKVFEKPKDNFKCAITNKQLVSVQDIIQGINTDEFKDDIMAHMKSMFSEDKVESPVSKLIGERALGVTGKDTTTFMSYGVAQEFYNWVITKSLKGDKHINWLLYGIRRSSFVERVQEIQDSQVQEKVRKIAKPKNVTTFSLGESSDILAKLKAKMENGE